MRDLIIFLRAASIVMIFLVSACARVPASPVPTEMNPSNTVPLPSETAISAPTTLPAGEPTQKEFEDFHPENFDRSTSVDNRWLPLKPGIQFIYEGFTNEGATRVPRRLISTITDLTKVIDGVRSVVTWDRDYSAGEMVETELAFFAQDKNGDVWRMGEHPEDYENGNFTGASTWISGIANARAGIEMQGSPNVGTDSYSQGWAPAVDFTDRAQVSQLNQNVCVKLACYKEVLVTDETSQAEPGAHQLKYYAPGVGNIKVDWKGSDQSQETLELVDIIQLSPEALAEARTSTVELEKHAYEVSPDVYSQTIPSEYPVGTPVITVKINPTPQINHNASQSQSEIVIHATDLQPGDLSEMEIWNDPASPGGRMIGLPNGGDELNAPPEDDPHATFQVQVQSSIPYRCWIHMKVGAPKGLSQANLVWVQFSDAVDKANKEVFKIGTDGYLTAQGSKTQGWEWVGCDLAGSDSLIYFRSSGEVNVRVQAGMEGVGFDQFILSSSRYLDKPPVNPIVAKK